LGSSTEEARLRRILKAIAQGENAASQIVRHVKLKLSSVPYRLQELERYYLIHKREKNNTITDKIIRDYFLATQE